MAQELKVHKTYDECGALRYYDVREVDAVIAEKDTEIAELKAKLESVQASAYAESVDAGMRERRLKRALYKAIANWAFLAQWERGALVENWEKWENVERKCGTKAEEYK